MERKLDTTIPTPPKVDIRRNPMEEQLIHVLDNILKLVPENSDDLLICNLKCVITYTFMLTKSPIRTALMFVRIKLIVASSGK